MRKSNLVDSPVLQCQSVMCSLVFVLVTILLPLAWATSLCSPPPGYTRSDVMTQGSYFKLHNAPGDEKRYQDAVTICSNEGGTLATLQHPNDPSEIETGLNIQCKMHELIQRWQFLQPSPLIPVGFWSASEERSRRALITPAQSHMSSTRWT